MITQNTDKLENLKGGVGIKNTFSVGPPLSYFPIKLVGDYVYYDSSFYDDDVLEGGAKPKFFKSGADTCVYKPYIPSENWIKNPPNDAEYVSRVVGLDTDELESSFYLKYILKRVKSLEGSFNPPYSIDKGVRTLESSRSGFYKGPMLDYITIQEFRSCGYVHNPAQCYNLITKTQGPTFYNVWESVKNSPVELKQLKDEIATIILTQFIPALVTLNTNGLIHNDLHFNNVAFWNENYKGSPGVIFDFGRAIFKYEDFLNVDQLHESLINDPFFQSIGASPQYMVETAISIGDSWLLIDNFVEIFKLQGSTPQEAQSYEEKRRRGLLLIRMILKIINDEKLDWRSRESRYIDMMQEYFKELSDTEYKSSSLSISPSSSASMSISKSPLKIAVSPISSLKKSLDPFSADTSMSAIEPVTVHSGVSLFDKFIAKVHSSKNPLDNPLTRKGIEVGAKRERKALNATFSL